MGANDLNFSAMPDYLMPAMRSDGSWASLGGVALRDSLREGSVDGVMNILKPMDARGVAGVLREAGFMVDAAVVAKGRSAVFSSVRDSLGEAIELQMDGFGLAEARKMFLQVDLLASQSLAAKESRPAAFVLPDVALGFSAQEFDGSMDAARVIQGVMLSSKVHVELLGGAVPSERGSMLLVAGQAMKKGVQGFGFEGLPGKYEVPLEMTDLVGLHRHAAQEVAVASTRAGLAVWAAGAKVKDLDAWVPDSVQRLLYGSVSMSAATALLEAIDGGGIAQHAGEIGEHQFTALLAAQGLDPNARTVEEVAQEKGLAVKEPNTERGQYYGPIIAVDHRAALVKYARDNVLVLAFSQLAPEQERPKLGDAVRMDFKNERLTVSVAKLERQGAER